MSKSRVSAVIAGFMCAAASNAALAVAVDLVTVGNPGNRADVWFTGCGMVNYTYSIGKYEITAGQYTDFLNAVAKTDSYGLYSVYMDATVFKNGYYGCDIKRSGSPGIYTYSVAPDRANRPVNYVNWGSAARFCNWLTNGQPNGQQDATTTEDGSYELNGQRFSAMPNVARRPNARYVIPTENEWYKAAYYDPNKLGGAGYWRYPTRSNLKPTNFLSATGTNNANFYQDAPSIDAPYWRTEVGAFANSPSPWGTFDQGGNVWEWNESLRPGVYGTGPYRGLRGSSWISTDYGLPASYRGVYDETSSMEYMDVGFRIAYVPEPTCMALLSLGAFAFLLRGRRAIRAILSD